jgi:hypothetical protein
MRSKAHAESPLAAPEFGMLRDVRHAFAHGGLASERTPSKYARLVTYRALDELPCLLDEYRRRVGDGERCRLVEREHGREQGRMVIELEIEALP